MVFQNFSPANPLDKHIETIFYYKDFMPDHSIERVVPTGHIFLIFELDGFTRHTYNNDILKPNGSFTKVWISGLHQNFLSISAHENSEMLVIQFNHTGAYPFIHENVVKLTEKVLNAELVFGNPILELRQKIIESSEVNDKFKVVEKWLLGRFKESCQPSDEIVEMVSNIKQNAAIRITDLQNLYSKTHKQLIFDFKKYVGINPKYFLRIIRFNEILLKIHQKEKISWSTISYECGYADQSHFIKDFKHFSGFNPEEFIKRDYNKDIPNFFPLD